MTNYRVMQAPGTQPTLALNGRSYAGPGIVDAPDCDADILVANGWTPIGRQVGPTSARPTNLGNGAVYVDTTLGEAIFYQAPKPGSGLAGRWVDINGNVV